MDYEKVLVRILLTLVTVLATTVVGMLWARILFGA